VAELIGWSEGSLRLPTGDTASFQGPPSSKCGGRVIYNRQELVEWMSRKGYSVGKQRKQI
jgi:hypothetical protein